MPIEAVTPLIRPDQSDFDQIVARFKWQLPEYFNIAEQVCDRHVGNGYITAGDAEVVAGVDYRSRPGPRCGGRAVDGSGGERAVELVAKQPRQGAQPGAAKAAAMTVVVVAHRIRLAVALVPQVDVEDLVVACGVVEARRVGVVPDQEKRA